MKVLPLYQTIFFFAIFSTLFVTKAYSDTHYGGKVFTTDTVHEVRLYFMQPHAWDTLIARYDAFHDSDSGEVKPLLGNLRFDGKELDSIGVKLKSNFSHSIPTNKKPIKLDFNAFIKERTLDGLHALNLSNEFPDPSMLRNTVAYKIYRDAGVRAPRTSFAKVFVNDRYKGLYVLIEQIDKIFISTNFKHPGGELIKPLASSLAWLAEDTMSFRKNFEIKSKNTPQAWSRLIAFAKKLNTTPAEIFYDSLKMNFDFNSYLPVFAADIVFNNWDSYFYGQNYYLYRDTFENRYYFLPWDYNVSLNNYEISGGDFSILPGGSNGMFFNLPLPSKVVNNRALKKNYLDEVCRINGYLATDSLKTFIYRMHEMIGPAMKEDTEKVMTMEQFDRSLIHRVTISEMGFVGLLSFINYRHQQVVKMLEYAGIKCKDKDEKK